MITDPSLFRLRRAVLHPNLVFTEKDERPAGDGVVVDVNEMIKKFAEGNEQSSAFAESVLANLDDEVEDTSECPICLDVMELPMIVPVCLHRWFVLASKLGIYKRLTRNLIRQLQRLYYNLYHNM